MKAIGTVMALLLLTISVSYPEQDRQLPPQKIAAIERLVASFMAKHKVPGLSVAIVVDGEPDAPAVHCDRPVRPLREGDHGPAA